MIHLNSIKKSYQHGNKNVEVLKGIDLNIDKGKFAAIMGPSGSGKSTLMNILGCLDGPTSGEYFLNEKKVYDFDEHTLAHIRNHSIGFVFQQFQLLPQLTASKNVELPMVYAGVSKRHRQNRAKSVLEKVGLTEQTDYFPSELSGGQKQRVAIARAIVNEPQIIIADEPTGALDTETSKQIMNLFTMLNADGTTIVVVTHEDDVAAYAERIVFLRDGLVIKNEQMNK